MNRFQLIDRHIERHRLTVLRQPLHSEDVINDRPRADREEIERRHLSVPNVRPRMMCFWNQSAAIMPGIAATMAADAISHQRIWPEVIAWRIPMVTGRAYPPASTNPKIRLFQLKMKATIIALVIPGVTSGTKTLMSVVHTPAPSSAAASSISIGTSRKKPVVI